MKTFSGRSLFRGALIGVAFIGVESTSVLRAATRTEGRQASARNLVRGFAADVSADAIRPADRAFFNKAAESGRQQMRLAEIGVSQAGNSDVRSHALQLATDYRHITDSLEALLRRKGGIAGAPVGGTSETYRTLVEKSGADFDRAFVRTEEQATRDMLALFEHTASESKDADVRDFAAAQLPVLRAHQAALAGLLKSVE